MTPLQLFRGYKPGERPADDFTPDKYHSSEFRLPFKEGKIESPPHLAARDANNRVQQSLGHYGGPVSDAQLSTAMVQVLNVSTPEAEKIIQEARSVFEKELGPIEWHLYGNRPSELGNVDGMFPCMFAPETLTDDLNTPGQDVRRGVLKSELGFDGIRNAGQTLRSIATRLLAYDETEIEAPFGPDSIMKRFLNQGG